MSDILIRHAESAAEIVACFPTIVQLRPYLADSGEPAAAVARQRAASYRILPAWGSTVPAGLAGYRVEENRIAGGDG